MKFIAELIKFVTCRLLMLAVLVSVLMVMLCLHDFFRRQEYSADQIRQSLLIKRNLAKQMTDDLDRLQKELRELRFYQVEARVEKQAEIRIKEMFLQEALREYNAAQRAVDLAGSGLAAKLRTFWSAYGRSGVFSGIFILFVAPLFLKIFMYWGVAWVVELFPPLVCRMEGIPSGRLRFHRAAVALDFPLDEGMHLLLRAGDWGKKRSGVRARTRFMWSWRYPIVSCAANLCEMVEFMPAERASGVVTVTSPDPDVFIARIDLNGGGIVVRPRHLVGFCGDVRIRTKWDFRLHQLLSGRIRHIVLYGTGSILLAGAWGVEVSIPGQEDHYRLENDLLLGYEVASEYSLCRTETFWHYLRGQTALFDQKLAKGMFFSQNNRCLGNRAKGGFLERTVNAVLNGVGGLLGF